MRTIPAALQTAIAKEALSLCRLVRITRQDAVVLSLTDSVYTLGIGVEAFRADIGFTISSIAVGLNLSQASGVTLSIALTDSGVTKNDVRSRRYYGATVEIYECDWTNPEDTMLLVFSGMVGRATLSDSGAVDLEVNPPQDDASFADEQYSQTCRANLGDERCGFPIDAFKISFTVVSVPDDTSFVIDTFGPSAAANPTADYFGLGQLKFSSGDNAGWAVDVLSGNFATKTVSMFFPTPSPIVAGDTGLIYPGCNRQYSTCSGKFGNSVNFRGEPFAPQWSVT